MSKEIAEYNANVFMDWAREMVISDQRVTFCVAMNNEKRLSLYSIPEYPPDKLAAMLRDLANNIERVNRTVVKKV